METAVCVIASIQFMSCCCGCERGEKHNSYNNQNHGCLVNECDNCPYFKCIECIKSKGIWETIIALECLICPSYYFGYECYRCRYEITKPYVTKKLMIPQQQIMQENDRLLKI